jgi:uncharacterized protein YbaA (DUF1428 family)
MSTFAELRKVDVSKHVEKKNNLSYLSWAWAVDELLQRDPTATWSYSEPKMFGETMMLFCTVKAFGVERTAQLPVMNHANKAIQNPDAFQVNTAMQRCLAKAIALHGLGLYIYAGEDLPESDKPPEKKDGTTRPAKNSLESYTRPAGMADTTVEEVLATVEVVKTWIAEGSIGDAVMTKDAAHMDADETVFFWTFFDSKERSAMKAEHEKIVAQYKQLETA